jgi:hypothetical protein
MIHFWVFFFISIFSALRETRVKNFYQSFICFVFFAAGVVGVVISLFVWVVLAITSALKN